MKRCGGCKQQLDESQFGKNKRTPDGLRCYCKRCSCEATKRSQLKNVLKHTTRGSTRQLPRWMQVQN